MKQEIRTKVAKSFKCISCVKRTAFEGNLCTRCETLLVDSWLDQI